MTDEQIVLAVLRRLLTDDFWDLIGSRKFPERGARFLVDGSIDVSQEETEALKRWFGDA